MPRWAARACGAVPLAVSAFMVAVRLAGLDDGTVLAFAVPALPFTAAGGGALLAVLIAIRRWRLAAVAAVLVAVQLAWCVPRLVPDGPAPEPGAPTLRVATVNTHRAAVDPAALVALVWSQRIDVLAVQELTAAGVRALDRAGLAGLMPHRELHPEVDSSIYSRRPLVRAGLLDRPTTWPQTVAELEVGGRTVRVVAVHTHYPGDPRAWAGDLDALAAETTAAGPDLVLLGDFNATLDHAPLRRLLRAGVTDAHAATGRGWAPTWPAGGMLPPLVPLDRVLYGSGLVAVRTGEYDLPGTDHRAVVAELALRSRPAPRRRTSASGHDLRIRYGYPLRGCGSLPCMHSLELKGGHEREDFQPGAQPARQPRRAGAGRGARPVRAAGGGGGRIPDRRCAGSATARHPDDRGRRRRPYGRPARPGRVERRGDLERRSA